MSAAKKKTTPQKRVAPRDKEDRLWNRPLTPAEHAALLLARKEAVNSGLPTLPESYFDLEITQLSASIDGDAIVLTCVIAGSVQRPEAAAEATGQTVVLRIPATVTRYDDAGGTGDSAGGTEP